MRPERCFGGLAGTALSVALAAALALALAAAALALFPAAAGAQTRGDDESAASVAVRPGDSLWSISEGRLGPEATPRRVLKGAERIHALNRARIGPDPDLLLVGQELLLPPAMSGREAAAATPARETAEAAREAGPAERGARGAEGGPPASAPTSAQAAGGEAVSGGRANGPAEPDAARAEQATAEQATAEQEGAKQDRGAQEVGAEIVRAEDARPDAADRKAPRAAPRVSLPDAARAGPVPAARGLAPDGPPPLPFAPFLKGVGSGAASAASALAGHYEDADGRRLAGLAAMALGLSAAALGARRLLARGGRRAPRDAWRPYYSPLLAQPPDRPPPARPAARRGAGGGGARDAAPGAAPPEDGAGRDRGPSGARAPAPGNGTGRVGLAGMARLRRRAVSVGRATRAARRPQRGRLATGAYTPEVRRSLRAAGMRKGGRP